MSKQRRKKIRDIPLFSKIGIGETIAALIILSFLLVDIYDNLPFTSPLVKKEIWETLELALLSASFSAVLFLLGRSIKQKAILNEMYTNIRSLCSLLLEENLEENIEKKYSTNETLTLHHLIDVIEQSELNYKDLQTYTCFATINRI